MIDVVLPTRGLIRGKTIESLLRELKGVDYRLHIVDQLPLPDCFNIPVKENITSLSQNAFLFIEEDVEMPLGALRSLYGCNSDIACVDYPLANGYGCVGWYKGKAMWCGTGCTLVKSYVFEKLRYPYFRSDVSINHDAYGWYMKDAPKKTYGGHDVVFGLRANLAGFTIKVVPNTTAKHHKIKLAPTMTLNGSVYEFTVLDTIKKSTILKSNPLEYLDKTVFSDL